MSYTLNEMFMLLENDAYKDTKAHFDFSGETPCPARRYVQEDIDFTCAYFSKGFNISLLKGASGVLFDLSFNAFDSFLHAWMSELPVEKEIITFGKKIISCAHGFKNTNEKQAAAKMAAEDRSDPGTISVMNAAYKVSSEVHKMMGLLRFLPDEDGGFMARCEPDRFILPCLGEYFTSRFGETAWSIIDDKRGLTLRRLPGEKAKLVFSSDSPKPIKNDEWEELWKHYHRTINNEDRQNPDLQRQLMPKRYWKHLPEMN
ncbi:MAG: TIGR03915 family putative DNA repair protein [Treponema sp.]|nr:TIGR03915 family putative DNA repair protein [Treponema sp.]